MKYLLCPCCNTQWVFNIKNRFQLKRYTRRWTKNGTQHIAFYKPIITKLNRATCPECTFSPEEVGSTRYGIDYQVMRQRLKMAGPNG